MTGRGPEPRSVERADDIPQAGDLLVGKYRVESVIGLGGMGIVLEVEHIELGQAMAIKLMLPSAVQDAETAVARFVREARAAASLQSEHVVRIYDVGTLETGLPYMVMERLRGQDVAAYLTDHGPMSVEEAVDCILQTCHAVAEAHARGIVHRDLKPSNLFLTRRSDGARHFKVLDFGISKALTSQTQLVSQHLTGTNIAMGSPLYMSPEQVRNAKHADVRSDVWSLGVILHELLTGGPAFQADTLPAICAAIIADPAPPLTDFLPDAPPELGSVIARCLEKDVTRRYQRIDDLVLALLPFDNKQDQQSSRWASPDPTRATTEQGSSQRHPGSVREAPPQSVDRALSARHNVDRPNASRPFGSPAYIVDTQVSSTGLTNPPSPRRRLGAVVHGLTASSAGVAFQTLRSGRPLPIRSRRRPILVAAGLGLLALAGGLVSIRGLRWHSAPPAPAISARTILGVADVGAGITASGGRTAGAFQLTIESAPMGVEVVEGTSSVGWTPLTVSIENDRARSAPRRLTLHQEGYQPYLIVQGPSDHDIHLRVALTPTAEFGPSASQAVSAMAPHSGTTHGRHPRDGRDVKTAPAPEPTSSPSSALAAPPIASPATDPRPILSRPPDDIRLER